MSDEARRETNPQPVVVVMGVSGTGKSTIGTLLAEHLGVSYGEADALHPQANIDKMSAGIPLTDEDRAPWLDLVGEQLAAGPVVVGCSALKRVYRDRLRAAAGTDVYFVHLTGSYDLIASRLGDRSGHFFPRGLLDSQFAALEDLQDDEAGLAIGVDLEPEVIAERAARAVTAFVEA